MGGSGAFIAKNSDATSWHELLHHYDRFAPSFVTQPNGPQCTKIVRNAPKHEFRVQWGGSDAFVVKNLKATYWHKLLHQFSPFCTEFHKSTKTVPNAPKLYEMHQNMSLGSNGMDRVCSFRKISMRLRTTNFCTSSARFAPSFVTQPNGPKCTKIVQNAPKHEIRVQWGGLGAMVAKNTDTTSWCELCTSSAHFAPSFVNQPNGPKCTKIVRTHQIMSLGSNGVDRVRSLRKIPTRLHGTNFYTSSARFAPSFVRQPNGPKCTQIEGNAPNHQFRVQWGGSGAFLEKKSDATSWHELLH